MISKFKNIDLQATIDEHCCTNVFGKVDVSRLQTNRAQAVARDLKLSLTLKRIPPVASFEHADEARYQLFVKTLWNDIYQNCNGYTVILVPSYFDFVRLRSYIRDKNQNVAMISEYSEKKECQRLRSLYEMKEAPILMITERALVFQKIRVRFARNMILYAMPESPDIIEHSF